MQNHIKTWIYSLWQLESPNKNYLMRTKFSSQCIRIVLSAWFGNAPIISIFVETSSERKKSIVALSFIGAGGQKPVFVQNRGNAFTSPTEMRNVSSFATVKHLFAISKPEKTMKIFAELFIILFRRKPRIIKNPLQYTKQLHSSSF